MNEVDKMQSQSRRTKEYSWLPIQTAGLRRPTARVGHTVNVFYDKDDQQKRPLLLFLGGADTKSTFNEASLLDVNSAVWVYLSVPHELESPRLARYEHASALVGEKEIYVFGGATKEGPLSGVSGLLVNQEKSVITSQLQEIPSSPKFTLSMLSKVAPQFPNSPRTQYGCNCTTELGQLLVFAGAGLGSEPVLDKQVHLYDSVLNVWKVTQTSGDIPEARFGHLQIYHPPCSPAPTSSDRIPSGKLYLHGGMAENEFYGDVYELTFGSSSHDEITATWRKLFPLEASASFVPDAGSEDVSNCEEETATLWARAAHGGAILPIAPESTSPTRLFIFGGLTQSGPVNDASYFCLESGQWTNIGCTGFPPAPRFDFAYCLFESSNLKTCGENKPEGADGEAEHSLSYYFFIHGGMDVEGNLFDDCMALRLPDFGEG